MNNKCFFKNLNKYLLAIFFILSVFLPLSKTISFTNTNNTSVSSTKQNNNVGAAGDPYTMGEQTFTYDQTETGTKTFVNTFTGGGSVLWFNGGMTASHIERTGLADLNGTNPSYVLRGTNNIATVNPIPTGCAVTLPSSPYSASATGNFSSKYATNSTRLLTIMNASSNAAISNPTLSITPSSCTAATYQFSLKVSYYYKVSFAESYIGWVSAPTVFGIPGSYWYVDETIDDYSLLAINLIWPIKIVINPPPSRGGYIDGSTSISGTYGTAASSTYTYKQTTDSSESGISAKWSIVSENSGGLITFNTNSSTDALTNNLKWTNTITPGTYAIKIKAISWKYSSDTPQMDITLTIKYAQPKNISITSLNPYVSINDKAANAETDAFNAKAYTTTISDFTYVTQTFSWQISELKKNNNTFTQPAWMTLTTNNASASQSWFVLTNIPEGSDGVYTFTMTATTTTADYTSVSGSFNYTMIITPLITSITVTSPGQTILGKSHVQASASDAQKFTASIAPTIYSNVALTWAVTNVSPAATCFSIDSSGKLQWTNAVRFGTYTVTVSASAFDASGTGTCTVDISRPDPSFDDPNITYTGKTTFKASTLADGTANANFVAHFEQEDAAPPTWSITSTGAAFNNNLLYITSDGTLTWKATLAVGIYTFYVTATNGAASANWIKPSSGDSGYTVITLEVVSTKIDDVVISNPQVIQNINIDSGSTGTSNFEIQGLVTHLDQDSDYNFTPHILLSNSTAAPTFLGVTDKTNDGKFRVKWNSAVKGTYTLIIYLEATINGTTFGTNSTPFTITVSDIVPTSLTVDNISLTAFVATSGVSTQPVSASAFINTNVKTNVDQTFIWSISNLKNPSGSPSSLNIQITGDKKISWPALNALGNWTFDLKATSAVNSSVFDSKSITIAVGKSVANQFTFDTSPVLPNSSDALDLTYGHATYTSVAPDLTATFNGNPDWTLAKDYTVTYAIQMESGSQSDAALSINSNGQFIVGSTSIIGKYSFVITINISGTAVWSDISKKFFLNINAIDGEECIMDHEVNNSSTLIGYKGFPGETSDAPGDGFAAHMQLFNTSQDHVLQDISYEIIMTYQNGNPNPNISAPNWLKIGPQGEIEWTPSASAEYWFKVRAYSRKTNVGVTSSSMYTLMVTDGTVPSTVQINNKVDLENNLSTISWKTGTSGTTKTAVEGKAYDTVPHFLTGITYSLQGTSIPSWMHIDSTTGIIKWDSNWEVGNYEVTIRAASVGDDNVFDIFTVNMNFLAKTSSSSKTTIIVISVLIPLLLLILLALFLYFKKHKGNKRHKK